MHTDGATTHNTKTSTCTRCGRILRAAKSIADRMGRTCKAKIRAAAKATARARYAHKPHLVAKAEEAIEAGVVVLRGKVCLVPGSKGAVYRSHPASCNCKAGLRAKHLCHHRIAADFVTAAA